MRILCLDIPAPGATLEHYAPHLTRRSPARLGTGASPGFIRDIYFRRDRPGVSGPFPRVRHRGRGRIMSWPNFRWQKRVS